MNIVQHNKIEIDGNLYDAIKFWDDEKNFDIKKGVCHDCGIKLGEFHHDNCDMEECPVCGGQLISCDCNNVTYIRTEGFVPKKFKWEK